MITKSDAVIDAVIMVYKPDKRLYRSINMLRKQRASIRTIYLMNTVEKPSDVTELFSNICEKVPGFSKDPEGSGIKLIPVRKSDFGHGKTRQLAAERSDADFILYLTQDAIVINDRLTEELLNSLIFYDMSAVAYGRQLPGKRASETEKFVRAFNYPPSSMHKTSADIEKLGIKTYFCSDVCAMYKMDIHRRLGGFETYVNFNEDLFFAYRAIQAGYSVEYAAAAKVVHYHNNTLKELFLRNAQNAYSQKKFGLKKTGAENEGMRLVRSAASYFLRRGKILTFSKFILETAAKYTGFLYGKHIM